MEVLNLIIVRNVHKHEEFKYHWKCAELEITHLCFADDLLLFCHGDVFSVKVLKAALDEFSGVSGLKPNLEKSRVFFGNVFPRVQTGILNVVPFKVGKLPVRYLGVPLLSTRLSQHHCLTLIEKVKKKLQDWKNKTLSFAGRLQLVHSVLSSMQIYWASVFILPASILNDLERLIRGFLWCHGEFKRGKAKVKWTDVCIPKQQGGLGLKSLQTWNSTLIVKHLWNIVSNKESLWVKWVNTERLKGRNFWDYPVYKDTCCGWRKIVKSKVITREHIVSRLGDGASTSIWYDNWHPIGPLCNFISRRNIYEAGLGFDCKVSSMVDNGMWLWPEEWRNRFGFLFAFPPPQLIDGKKDRAMWKTNQNRIIPFTIKDALVGLRGRAGRGQMV